MNKKKKNNSNPPKTKIKLKWMLLGIISIVFAAMLSILFTIEATHNLIAYKNWDTMVFKEYEGNYQLSAWRPDHSSYFIHLDNGDTILVRKTNAPSDKYAETPQIYVKYSPFKVPILQGFNPVCVTSLDGSIVFVDADQQKEEFQIFITLYIMALLPLGWIIMLMWCLYQDSKNSMKRKKLHTSKKKRKRNNM